MNSDKPFVSIIVLNYNGKKWLKDCFESLEKLNYPKDKYEVIMGDNASTDDSVEYVKENFPEIRVLQFDKNYGFCKGNNLCAKEAKGEYSVFLNNDTFVEKEWLNELVIGVLSEENVISTVGKLLIPNLNNGERNIINAAGGVIFPDGCGLYEGFMQVDSDMYNKQKYTGFGCGAGVLVQKNFFIFTGGFDEYYFYTGEENDLGFRVWSYGFKVMYVPSAIMYHYTGKTGSRGKGTTPMAEFIVTRNKLYFILKNFDRWNMMKGIILHIFRSSAMIFYAILHKNIHVPIGIMKSYFVILKDLKKIYKNRKIAQKNKKVQDKELYKIGVIINVKAWVKTYYDGLKNTRKVGWNVFDTKDSVKIKTNKDGEFIFYKN
ncbi:hypothetical protein MSIBF_A20002 [groundwater metagenome]|uniref:Glycosyltransferase 2-like domain-containing protein n=1 Tax=groundwater metagenome TaxID=717931 RepID=A0A098E807_9ZZZZ